VENKLKLFIMGKKMANAPRKRVSQSVALDARGLAYKLK